jgi:RTX calcium-binding nonapeptide repeat (4 copies)
VVDDAGAGDSTEIPAEVETLRAVELREHARPEARKPVDLQRLNFSELRELADVAVRRDHEVPRGIGELVEDHERFTPPVDDEAALIVAFCRAAEDAAVLLVGLLDVLEAPRRPQRFGHGAEVRASTVREQPRKMPVRAALAVVPVVLVAGVSSASAQQTVPTCLEERATILGTPGNDALAGTPGQDVIVSLQGNDTVDGGLGDDLICAGDGDDVVLGNNGDDGLVGGLGNDRLDGGAGEFNIAVYLEAPGPVAVDLAASAASGASGADSLANITAVLGSRNADTLKGGSRSDVLAGLGGNDVLVGRAGDDLLSGFAGNDQLTGGGGQDLADYSTSLRSARVNLSTGRAFGEGRDRLREVEGVIGGPRGDTLIGDRQRNLLVGGAGSDTLEGRAGRDSLVGGAGRDTVDGGAGRDRCRTAEIKRRCP